MREGSGTTKAPLCFPEFLFVMPGSKSESKSPEAAKTIPVAHPQSCEQMVGPADTHHNAADNWLDGLAAATLRAHAWADWPPTSCGQIFGPIGNAAGLQTNGGAD